MIKAKVVADSINTKTGDRLTTLEVVMPRYLVAELNTHRALSKNSASSRAIPFKKMLKSVQENPFIPMAWQKDHKGMQGTEYLTDEHDIEMARLTWLDGRDDAANQAERLHMCGVTKQMCNRILEPFLYHTVLVSGTEWQNFFDLRCPSYKYENKSGGISYFKSRKDWLDCASWNYVDSEGNDFGQAVSTPHNDVEWLKLKEGQADIHIMAVAEAIWDAMNESTPNQLNVGDWHVPFGENRDDRKLKIEVIKSRVGGSHSAFIQSSMEYDNHSTSEVIDHEFNKAGLKIVDLNVKVATARCARLSYQTLGEEPKIDYQADLKLHDMLLKSGHYSPFEHCAQALDENSRSGNFTGWNQYRKIIESWTNS